MTIWDNNWFYKVLRVFFSSKRIRLLMQIFVVRHAQSCANRESFFLILPINHPNSRKGTYLFKKHAIWTRFYDLFDRKYQHKLCYIIIVSIMPKRISQFSLFYGFVNPSPRNSYPEPGQDFKVWAKPGMSIRLGYFFVFYTTWKSGVRFEYFEFWVFGKIPFTRKFYFSYLQILLWMRLWAFWPCIFLPGVKISLETFE